MTDPTTAMQQAREALEKIAEPISSRRNDAEWLLMVIDLRRRIAMDALAQLDAALAQPSEEARDAARYRWLRDSDTAYVEPVLTALIGCCGWDEAIDAAMQAKDGAR